MLRFIPILLFLVLSIPELHAQKKMTMKKRFREAETAIKTASNQENIESILLDSILLLTTNNNVKAEGFHLCALLQHSVNEGLNTRAYLKQQIDTIKLYNTIFNIYKHTLNSDTYDEKQRFANKNNKLREQHRDNLLGGGKFFMRKSNWTEAYSYFDMFLRTSTIDMDSVIGRVAYWATVCGMNENNPHHVLEYVDTAIALTPKNIRPALAEYKARSYVHIGDSSSWRGVLQEGVKLYPGHNYFFLNLMDYYMRHNQTERGLSVTDSLIRTDGDRAVYWFALSMFALAQGDYDRCITMSEECLKREPDNIDALYNKGISLLNMALNEKSTIKRRNLYKQSLEPMERVRQLSPNDLNKWGNPLYRIYLNLNMGKKFEEIDKLLDQKSKQLSSKRKLHDNQIGGISDEVKCIDKHLAQP